MATQKEMIKDRLRNLIRLRTPDGPLVGLARIQATLVMFVAPSLAMVGALIVLVFFHQGFELMPFGIITGIGASLILAIAPFMAAATGNLPLTGSVIIFSVWISLSVGAFETAGIRSAQIFLLVQLPIWATFFKGRRGGFTALFLVMFSILSLVSIGPTSVWQMEQTQATLILADGLMALTAASIVLVIVYIQDYQLNILAQKTLEAEKSNAAKSEFLSSMSHELRTPLNSIIGFSQLLAMDGNENLDPKQKKSLEYIRAGGEHLLELIDQVLDLSKIESGKVNFVPEVFQPSHVLRDSAEIIRPMAKKKGVTIKETSHSEKLIRVDPVRLKQVLINLLSNAAKYIRDNGEVFFGCEERGQGTLRLFVTDTGYGIPPDKGETIFEPFNRLGMEASSIEGTGVGLTISKRLVEAMEGTLEFSSKMGKGTTFWVDFPVSTERATRGASSQNSHRHPNTINPKEPDTTVLYIEDNPASLQLMTDVLDQIGGISMLTAHNAEIGLSLAEEKRPDLILMDINLPGMDGITAAKKLNHNHHTTNIPIIAISAAASEHDIGRSNDAGFKAYLTKPFDVLEISSIIKKELGS